MIVTSRQRARDARRPPVVVLGFGQGHPGADPVESLLAFRLRLQGFEGDALDDLNRRLMERINARQRVFLTGTVVPGIRHKT